MSRQPRQKPMPPLIVPRTHNRHVRHHSLSNVRWARLKQLAEAANVRRPGHGSTPMGPSIGAMLEALATGELALVRMDDPERRLITAAESCAAPRPDPRDPGAWD